LRSVNPQSEEAKDNMKRIDSAEYHLNSAFSANRNDEENVDENIYP